MYQTRRKFVLAWNPLMNKWQVNFFFNFRPIGNPFHNLATGHSQYSHSVLSDFTQQLQWYVTTFNMQPYIVMKLFCFRNPMYQLQQAAFPGSYPLPQVTSSAFPNFGRNPLMPHPSLSGHSFSHPSFLTSASK